jgi:hypothetical protein
MHTNLLSSSTKTTAMSDIRRTSDLRKRLSTTAVLRDCNQNLRIPRKANQKFALIPRKILSTAASEDALPLIKKRKTSSPSEEPNPSDLVKNTVRLREAIENRTLFCHNVPDVPGTHFRNEFETIMRDNELSFYENVISQCSKSGPRDFKMVFVNADMAARALNLDGFTLRDRTSINLRRPPKYNGPETRKITWNKFAATRHQSDVNNIRKEKNEREVYVKQVPLGTNNDVLQEFLGDTIQRASLNICQGNPIISCKVKGNTGFISLRTSEEAAATLNLNNIPFRGARLLFERNRNVAAGRYQENLHHNHLKISIAKDAHRAPCPQRLEIGDFELQGSQLPVSMIPPRTSGDGSCCSLLPQDPPPPNHEDITAVDLTEEDPSTPPMPRKKRVRFNLKEEDEACGTANGKAKHQACAKVGLKSAAQTLVTQDCHTTVDETHTNFLQSVLDKVNKDRVDLTWQLEKANVENALLQKQLSEMAKRLAESDASRACFEKSVLNGKRELPAAQQKLLIMRKMWRRTTHELEDIRQQLQEATENKMQAASIHFDKPLLGSSIKQEESFVKCEGGIQYSGSEQVRVLLQEEEEYWDV